MTLDQAQNISLEELDKQVLLHPVTSIAEHQEAGPVVYGKSGGVKVYDRQGQRLYRRRSRALVRQHRLRADEARRGRGRGNGAHRLLPQLRRCLQRAADPARREAALAAARARGLPPHRQGVLRPLRLGRQRHPVQAGPLLQQPARPAREEEDHLPHRRLPRRHQRGRQPHRHPRSTTRPSTCPSRACCTPTARTTGGKARTARARRRSRTAWWLRSRR